ncbi:uncharacterized protein LOC142538567 [Primulina tabacum]|uniref:uncharacterized protein LOC142538567 n=1 Tax=Primulina tabacum TaxID=48773 RepID=UPI003F5A497E
MEIESSIAKDQLESGPLPKIPLTSMNEVVKSISEYDCVDATMPANPSEFRNSDMAILDEDFDNEEKKEEFFDSITTHKLNGRNYLQWAQSVKIVICGRGKLGCLTGELKPPTHSDSTHKNWLAENSIVLAWLINSMEPEISRRYLWFHTANETFDIWQELDLFRDDSSSCADCSIKIRSNLEKEWVFDFLAGLNRNLDDVRGRVVARDPFPSSDDAFAEVRREEMQRKVMFSDYSPIPPSVPDVSALATQKSAFPGQHFHKRPSCDHCKRPGHTKDKCWAIYDKPANWQPKKKNEQHGYQALSLKEQPRNSENSAPFPNEQIAQIEEYCRLIRQASLNPPQIKTVGSCSMTQSGNLFSALRSYSIGYWIVDFGASDHMTSDFNLFCTYKPCSAHTSVKIANGSMTPVAGFGSIRLSKDVILKSVFHVLTLTCNMISCDICHLAKHTRNCFPPKTYTPTAPFSLIHNDIWGPSPSATSNGYKCYCPHTKKTYVSRDVTFLENTTYFPPPSLPGRNLDTESWWDTPSLPICDPLHEIPQTPDTNFPKNSHTNSQVHIPIQETEEESTLLQELKVYSRRKKPQATKDIVNPNNSQEDEPVVDPQSNTTLDLDLPIAVRKRKRSCTQHPISNFVSYSNLSSSFRAFASRLSSTIIPGSFQEELVMPEWRNVVLEEMKALKMNNTWNLVELSQGKTMVGCKSVFTVKYRVDGSIERYKARLVARGFTQTYGIDYTKMFAHVAKINTIQILLCIDYTETFAPVAKINTIRIMLSLPANLDWPLHQFDIKNAFLNGDLEEEVYMSQPPGFEERFSPVIKKLGYVQGQADHTLFFKHSEKGKITIFIVYVDDIIVTGDNNDEMEMVKLMMAKQFEVKDLGTVKYFLGMEIARSKKGISISQRKYTLDLLKETCMLGCKPGHTPIDPGNKGKMFEGGPVDKESYQRLVGKLIYLSHTLPNIAFAVSLAIQYMHSPCQGHLNVVYIILRYLKQTLGRGLFLEKTSDRRVTAFIDSDWAGSITDRKSTSGYCTIV